MPKMFVFLMVLINSAPVYAVCAAFLYFWYS